MWSTRLARLALVYALALVALRVTVAAPTPCPTVDPAEARAAARAAADWIVENQQRDGTYTYLQYDDGREDPGFYNNVRHAGATLSLYQAARELGDKRYRVAADRGLEWMEDRLEARDGWRALTDGSYVPVGGSALMLAALAERRELTENTRYDRLMRGLGRFLVSMQRADGGFYVWLTLPSGEKDTESTSAYYPGEALWALSRLDAALPARSWQSAVRGAAHYLATKRDRVEHVRVPPINDHWASYGYAQMARNERPPLDGDEVDYSRDLYARFALLGRWEAQRDAGALYGLTHGPARRAAAVGTWLEGQAALARLTRADARLADLQDETLESAECVGAVLIERQRDDGPAEQHGAWFVGGETRVDDQQHAISGLLALADLTEAEQNR